MQGKVVKASHNVVLVPGVFACVFSIGYRSCCHALLVMGKIVNSNPKSWRAASSPSNQTWALQTQGGHGGFPTPVSREVTAISSAAAQVR